jgi:type IV fimbrial biogenesis protein FimT
MTLRNRQAKGYTLVELMMVLGIVGVLLLVAIPMFRTQVQNSRMSAAATDLLSTLTYARAEAIGRRSPVTVCISNDAADDCAKTGQWEDGWLTFVNLNDDDNIDDEEEIIQIHPPLAAEMFASGESEIEEAITFLPNGHTRLSTTRLLIICDGRDGSREDDPIFGDNARAIIVTILGKASISKAENTGSGQLNCKPTS